MTSAGQVWSPTAPSTPSPADDWKARTAASVDAPKTPSMATEYPCARNRYCTVCTGSRLLPLFCRGQVKDDMVSLLSGWFLGRPVMATSKHYE